MSEERGRQVRHEDLSGALTFRWLSAGVLGLLLVVVGLLWQTQVATIGAMDIRIAGLSLVQTVQGERVATVSERLNSIDRQLTRMEAKLDQLAEKK